MEQINPYAVMRNTATHEAYKAYNRKVAMAGQPFVSLAFALIGLTPAMGLFAREVLHRPHRDPWVAFACYFVPVTLAAVLAAIGGVRVLRFKKANPIPDEWRLVPRANPLRNPQTPA